MRKLFTILSFVFVCFQAKSTHIAGGEITYTHLSGMDYHIKLQIYIQCGGTSASSSETIQVSSTSLGSTMSLTAPQTANGLINSYCQSVATTCTLPSSIYPGFKYYIYEATVTLPAAASDWTFSYNQCCRNNAISNLVNPGSAAFSISSTLNNLTGAGGFNNSVNFINTNGLAYLVNQPNVINQTAIDIDGDSLVFSLTSPMSSVSTPCTFASGYSAASPFGSGGSISIDPINGNLNFSNMIQTTNVFAIKVAEFRNGILIGSCMRDLQFLFMNGGPNQTPSLSGVNGTANYFTSINVCPGAFVHFTVNGTDPDISDSTILSTVTPLMTGATFTTNSALQQTGTFDWTPSLSDIRPQPYLLVIEAHDNTCLVSSRGYLIYVNQCNTDSVWAGDANADYIVNNYDVLNIGIGNGTSGVVRPGASTNWVAEYCPNWTNSFMSGINHKHADCNGDGTIDANDMNAVTLNYGQFHLKGENVGSYKTAGFPDLFVDVSGINANAGSTLQIPVKLGTVGTMMNNIYGIAGHIKVSNNLSGNLTLNANTSWLGNTGNSMLFQKNINSNDLAFTLVRKNQTNVSGEGQIAILSIPLAAAAIQGSDLSIVFTDLKLIDKEGIEMNDYNVINDTLKVKAPTGTMNSDLMGSIEIFPNPAKDFINIRFLDKLATNKMCALSIMDMSGKIFMTKQVSASLKEHRMNTSSLPKGVYFLSIQCEDEQVKLSFVK